MTPPSPVVTYWQDVLPSFTHVRCPFWLFLSIAHPSSVARMPEHTFDVHVLRTFKRDLIALLTQLQASLPRPSEAINQVIFILNQTFRDVELSYLVWRQERVQSTLQHGVFPLLLAGGRYLTQV